MAKYRHTILLAICVLSASAVLIFGKYVWPWPAFISYQREHEIQRAEQSDYSTVTAKEYFHLCVDENPSTKRPISWLECAIDAVTANKEDQRAGYDLRAQQDMALWAFSILLVSIIGVIVSIGGLIGLFWTLRETRRIGQAQVRAYPAITRGRIKVSPDKAVFVSTEIKNFGQSPVREGAVYAQALIIDKAGEWVHMSEPAEQPIFTITAGSSTIAQLMFEDDTDKWIADTLIGEKGIVVIEAQLRWLDVFGAKSGPDEFSLTEDVDVPRIISEDGSCAVSMSARTKQPSDEE